MMVIMDFLGSDASRGFAFDFWIARARAHVMKDSINKLYTKFFFVRQTSKVADDESASQKQGGG
jgi:hypothetical protein